MENWMCSSMEMVPEEQIQPVISPKRIKIEENLDEVEEKDRISALPDCLLVQILSRLPSTKDAIRTGILSKRWKSLWTSIPTLIFEHDSYKHPNPDFVSSVSKTLTQCHHKKLNKSHVSISYNNRFESQVNSWIHYAINCHVEELVIKPWNLDHRLQLQQHFFIASCFTHLALGRCVLNPNGAISWKMLRRLYISEMYLDEDLIGNILSGSPVLETLELECCYGYSRLDITSKSVKNLVLLGYFDPNDHYDLADVIEINAPNILSLKIHCEFFFLWKVLLLDVSSLVKVELNYTKYGHYETTRKEAREEMLKGLIQSLRNVKELKVGTLCSAALSRLEAKGFLFPSNMKFPDVYCSDSDSLEEGDFSDDDSLEGEDL